MTPMTVVAKVFRTTLNKMMKVLLTTKKGEKERETRENLFT